MNKSILMGRLTRDPEVTQKENLIISKFTLAVNRRFIKEGEERQADFINITSFGKTAEFVQKYFKKGQQVAVIGRIQNRSWEVTDETTGEITKRYATDIIAEEVYFADSKKETSGDMQFENTTSNEIPSIPADELPF